MEQHTQIDRGRRLGSGGARVANQTLTRILLSRSESIDGPQKEFEVDWLRQVLVEARGFAVEDIGLHTESAQRDRRGGVSGAQLGHEFESGAIRKAKVADDQIKGGTSELDSRSRAGGGCGDGVPPAREEPGHGAEGVGVIFDEEDPGGRVAARRGVCIDETRLRDKR